jgi:hypothetical protein
MSAAEIQAASPFFVSGIALNLPWGFSFCSANRGLADLRATGCLIEGLPSTAFELFTKKYSRANEPCQEEIIKINKKTVPPLSF